MKEDTLLKIALSTSIIGIMGLFLLSQTIAVDETAISKLDGMQDESVVISGVVKRVAAAGNITFLTVEKLEEVTVVVFDKVEVEEGSRVSVDGRVAEYEGETEIIADRIDTLR